jgi:hypothetical protein
VPAKPKGRQESLPLALARTRPDVRESLDPDTEAILHRYVTEVSRLPNESAKTHSFVGLITSLFPGHSAVKDYLGGIEKVVRIDTAAGERRRRIDAYYGNAVIEFEKSLAATGRTAERQLREYACGVWTDSKQRGRPLLCVASDGIHWQLYSPRLAADAPAKLRAQHVSLDLLRTFEVKAGNLHEFWLWLTGFLFRPSRAMPSAERFQAEFGASSPAFADATDALSQAWQIASSEPEPQLAFETWKKYLTFTYGGLGGDKKAQHALFLKHTYLVTIARLLVWASLSGGKTTDDLGSVAHDVTTGEAFEPFHVQNLAEEDFFRWILSKDAESILRPVWERVLDQMLTYDLGRLDQDVLKGVYQEMIDPSDRHELGEFYTPDWLCERIVQEVMPTDRPARALDPACGSGGFLRAAIVHLLAHGLKDAPNALEAVLDHVAGIDIHPVAVTIARATYLLAVRDLLGKARRPIQVPVYMADSLFLPQEVTQMAIGAGSAPMFEIRFGTDKKCYFPDALIKATELFDPTIQACARVAGAHAAKGRESVATLKAYLDKAVPRLRTVVGDGVVTSLWTFTEGLANLISARRNSIWSFIVRNAYRPAMLRERFDVILGNPPWITYSDISEPDYQLEIRRLAIEKYQIAPDDKKLITQMELGSVFLTHALSTFGKDNARLAFVMPYSVLRGDQHARLRTRRYQAPVRLDRYWDLDQVEPIFRTASCVLFATKTMLGAARDSYSLPAIEWRGKLSHKDVKWAEASERLTGEERTARVIYLGSRNAFSWESGVTSPTAPSYYLDRFHQGATLVPRNFYFVRLRNEPEAIDPDGVYWAETDPEQAKEAKAPYKEIHLRGNVEGRFLFSTAVSRHVLPFALAGRAYVVLPVMPADRGFVVLTGSELSAGGNRDVASWMQEAEVEHAKARRGKATQATIYQTLDHQRKLSSQHSREPYLVLYNSSGTNISACAIKRADISPAFIIDSKLYGCVCATRAEADYLAAVLNSTPVNEGIKPFQTRGIYAGERDIHKKPLEMPIPRFDPNKPTHAALAKAGAAARELADQVAPQIAPGTLAKRRETMRRKLARQIGQIDLLVEALLGTSASGVPFTLTSS